MRLGDFESAISMLEEFECEDKMIGPMAVNLIGDANMELGNMDKALELYLEAATMAGNEFLSPVFLMKAGKTCELLNDYKQALDIYKRIEKEYYNTPQQREIEKYIKRAEMKI
jgi:tetratricopeptide (TPR) repeat protein